MRQCPVQHVRFACLLFTLGVIVFASGCGSKEPTYPVRGQVVFKEDGQPAAAGGSIWFERTQAPYPRSGSAINERGEFTLGTNSQSDGAFVGEFRVRVDPLTLVGAHVASVAQSVDSKYFSFASSGIVQNVKPNMENVLRIEVERNRKSAAPATQGSSADDGSRVPTLDQ